MWRSRPVLAVILALALSSPARAAENAAAARDSANPITAFLDAYRTGDCAAFRAFVHARYHAKVLAKPAMVEQFATAFARLREDFGPLEPRGTSLDTTYKSTRHHLYDPVTEQWVTLMFVLDDSTGKARGHGLWRNMATPGWERPPDVRPLGERLRERVRALGDAGLFSGAVLLAGPDGPIVQDAAGTADGRRRLTSRDRFPIASITKMFTAAVIIGLEDEGKLGLADRISKHLPEYPKDIADQVTIRHLLQHTSGIEIDDNLAFRAAREAACSVDEALKTQIAFVDSMNEGRRPNFRPLDRYDYSNENYDLLAAIAERVSRQPFESLLAQRVLEPAGMRSTSFAGEPGLHGRTRFGGPDSCASRDVAHARVRVCPHPAGGLFSTTEDLGRFMAWLRSPRAGRASLFERMTADSVANADGGGYGLGVDMTGGAVGHNGGFAGASGELRWLEKEGLTLVVLCNRERAAPALLNYVRGELD